MHTLKIRIEDSVLDKVFYFLKHLPQNEVMIIEDKVDVASPDILGTKAFSHHTANLIEEWKDASEDALWK